MQEQFDKRLADKIRKEMKAYEPSFNPTHWSDMQKRMHGSVSNTRKRLFASFITLVLAGIAYLPLGNTTLEREGNFAMLKRELSEDKPTVEETASFFNVKEKELNNVIEGESQTEDVAVSVTQDLQIQVSQENKSNALLAEKIEQNSVNQPKLVESNLTFEKFELLNSTKVNLNETGSEVDNYDNLESAFKTNNSPLQFPELSLVSKNLVLDSASMNPNFVKYDLETNRGVYTPPKLSLSVIAEGFINQNNRVDNYSKIGFGFGALLNYKPSKKIFLSTGLIVEKLSGKAFPDQSEYEESENLLDLESISTFSAYSLNDYATQSQELTELVTVTSNFTAVEIPIQFSYYLTHSRNKRIYVSSSASSYFYLSEKYDYAREEFQTPTQFNTQKLSTVNEETEYGAFESFDLFSSLTFAVGIEKKIGIQTSLSLEPFVRVPIRKMGVERMRINTTGFRLRYNFGW